MNRFLLAAAVVSAVLLSGSAAYANSGELLNFQGLGDLQPVGNFYNGGGLAGTPNYGITFSSNFFGLRSVYNGGSGAFAPNPSGTPAIFVNGPGTATGYMNVTAGFSDGIQFFYTAAFTETITVWSGANGTGAVLATIALSANNGNCTAFPTYCNWSSIGLNFAGTAESLRSPVQRTVLKSLTLLWDRAVPLFLSPRPSACWPPAWLELRLTSCGEF